MLLFSMGEGRGEREKGSEMLWSKVGSIWLLSWEDDMECSAIIILGIGLLLSNHSHIILLGFCIWRKQRQKKFGKLMRKK